MEITHVASNPYLALRIHHCWHRLRRHDLRRGLGLSRGLSRWRRRLPRWRLPRGRLSRGGLSWDRLSRSLLSRRGRAAWRGRRRWRCRRRGRRLWSLRSLSLRILSLPALLLISRFEPPPRGSRAVRERARQRSGLRPTRISGARLFGDDD